MVGIGKPPTNMIEQLKDFDPVYIEGIDGWYWFDQASDVDNHRGPFKIEALARKDALVHMVRHVAHVKDITAVMRQRS